MRVPEYVDVLTRDGTRAADRVLGRAARRRSASVRIAAYLLAASGVAAAGLLATSEAGSLVLLWLMEHLHSGLE